MTPAWKVLFHSGLLLTAGMLTGCTSGGNSRSGLFGQAAHPLLPQAKEVAAAYPDPLPVPRELAKSLVGPYQVEPGDVLLLQPARPDTPTSIPADQPILPDGRIQLGVYGNVVVAGLTLEQIEAKINAIVRATTKDPPQVTVRLSNADSKVFYVLGEVNAPNSYPYRGRETVLDAIVRAGGLTTSASRRDIILSRPTTPHSCRIVLPVCYSEIVQLGDTTTNYQLKPGDRVYVPSRGMCESLFPTRPRCLPCGREQTPCPAPGCEGPPPVRPPGVGEELPGGTTHPVSTPPESLPAPTPESPAGAPAQEPTKKDS